MSRKVFISGASGFVGRHLIHLLDTSGFQICGTSYPDKPETFPFCWGKEVAHVDVRRREDVAEAVKRTQPDWVFHLAAVSNVRSSWESRQETMETNLMGTFHLLEAVRTHASQARILFVSSSDVYGVLSPTERPLTEEDPPHVVSPYAFTKVSGEILSRFYAEVEDLDVVVARSFPHTGPGQSPAFVCSDWASQVARIEQVDAEPVIRVGNTQVKRDFTDVRDVVKAYKRLLEKGKKGEIYNVCSGRGVSLKEILEMLRSLSKEKIEVEVDRKKLRKADIPYLVGDNSKIKEETGWGPAVPLSQTLADLLQYWREELAAKGGGR